MSENQHERYTSIGDALRLKKNSKREKTRKGEKIKRGRKKSKFVIFIAIESIAKNQIEDKYNLNQVTTIDLLNLFSFI